jgi:glutathione S-transferase
MELYYSPGACSLAPHIVSREAGLPVKLVRVDLATKKTETGADYHAVNGKGFVPAILFDDGEVMTEVAAIVQMLADRNPEPQLAPAPGTKERYRLVEWLSFIGAELHKGFGPLWNPATPEGVKTAAKGRLATQLTWLERKLLGRSYLMGESFGVADAYLFAVLNWAGVLEVDLTPYQNIRAFMARVAARPKVQDALRAEGLLREKAA